MVKPSPINQPFISHQQFSTVPRGTAPGPPRIVRRLRHLRRCGLRPGGISEALQGLDGIAAALQTQALTRHRSQRLRLVIAGGFALPPVNIMEINED